MDDAILRGDQISHYTKYYGKERPHKSGKRSYPYVKKYFKYPNPPGILA